MQHQSEELTRRAVQLAREAASLAPAHQRMRIAGSLAPLENCYRPDLTPSDDILRREHRLQARSLASAEVAACDALAAAEDRASFHLDVRARLAVDRVALRSCPAARAGPPGVRGTVHLRGEPPVLLRYFLSVRDAGIRRGGLPAILALQAGLVCALHAIRGIRGRGAAAVGRDRAEDRTDLQRGPLHPAVSPGSSQP